MKAIIIIGGGYLQLPQIRWAKELGLYAVVTDRNSNVIGRTHADQFEVLSGTDISSLLELARRVNDKYELVGAYASSDFGLPAVAAISEAFNLPGCSQKAVSKALNKQQSKEMWCSDNLPSPTGRVVQDYAELCLMVEEIGLPLILKPINSSGSQGVKSVWSQNELKDAYISAQRFSPYILVEQIVNGHHIDVNGLFAEGRFIPCGTMDRFFSKPPYHYPIWGCQPSILDSTQEKAVYQVLEQAARALDIDEGPVKGDVVWTDKGPVILEIAPRFHGDVSTSFVTPLATSCNPIKTWMAYLKGEENYLEYVHQNNKQFAGWMALFPATYGNLSRVVGIEAVNKINGIQDIYIAKKVGNVLKQAIDNTALCGFIWAIAASRSDLFKTLEKVQSTIMFVTE